MRPRTGCRLHFQQVETNLMSTVPFLAQIRAVPTRTRVRWEEEFETELPILFHVRLVTSTVIQPFNPITMVLHISETPFISLAIYE